MVKCSCGVVNPNDAKYCQECGGSLIKENNYDLATALGIIGTIFFIPLALICGVYLYTRPEVTAKITGKRIILVSILLWALFTIIPAMYSQLNIRI
ncbi:MAG TPA: hypothetical protein VGC02_03610 [Methanobacterium sp.]